MDDILSEILTSLRLQGTVYFCDELGSPWRKEFFDPTAASFHQVRRGGCRLEVDGDSELLGPGDMLFVGPGIEHALTSSGTPDQPAVDEAATLLLCGYCEFDIEEGSPLQALFPRVCVLRQGDIDQSVWLKTTLDQLAAEHHSPRPGALLVVNKLTEVLIVELIRENYGRGEKKGYLRALSDKRIGEALRVLHSDPAQSWTLESLAGQIGMSRANLAQQFKSLVGQPMFEYLTDLRMQRAKEMLLGPKRPLHEIAGQVGYKSEVAFTKAFKKVVGSTPTQFRKLG